MYNNIKFKSNFMENYFFNIYSKRFIFSAAIASFLSIGGTLPISARLGGFEMLQQSYGNVSGKVLDSNGEPIIGASVFVKGTTNGVITDIDGRFSLGVPSSESIIVISFIGYKTIEVSASDRKSLTRIVLYEDAKVLDEVVVVGYGTQKKETLTGSVTVVGKDIFKDKGTVSNPLSAMQGQVPGLRITRSSSAPGEEGWGISIRGAVSKNSVEPLLIIDGLPASGVSEMSQLNADDIESINFLKDASAAIYGAKAAGGVILVTTKRPDASKAKIEYSGSFTRKIVGLQPRLMSLDEWADGVLQARLNDGYGDSDNWIRYARLAKAMKGSWINLHGGSDPSEDPIPGGFRGVADFVFHDINWTDVLWGNANSTQHNLSVSGGSEKSSYRLSLGYLNDQSTLQWGNNSNERYNMRLFNSYKISNRVSLESNLSASRQHQVAPTQIGAVLGSSTPQPGLPVSTIDGKPYAWGGIHTPNWQAELGGDNKLVVTAMSLNEVLKVNILEGFDFQGTVGYSTNSATRDEQNLSIDWYSYDGTLIRNENSPYPAKEKSSYTKSSSRNDNYTVSGFITYKKSFNDVHDLSAMGGVQYDYAAYDLSVTKAMDVESAIESINGKGQIYLDKVDRWEEAILSYFGRFNYNYKSKYLLEVNARYDGSSKFLPENRWKFFWGASGGWRISEEAFMEGIRDYVSDLKLRLSYGEVGNQSGIGRYDGIQLYNYKSNSGVLLGTSKGTYVESAGLVSTVRTWERINNYNIGLDFGLLKNRLSGTFELFMKKNNNMLVSRAYPGVLGGTPPSTNDGKFEAKGYDASITWRDRIGNFNYHLGGTLTYMTNELKDGGSVVVQAGYNSAVNGYPLNSVFGYRYVGKVQNEEQLNYYLDKYLGTNSIAMPSNIRLGDHMYEDVNNDGKLTQDDLVFLGSDDPKYSFSFNFGFEWKGFDFNTVFQGVGKRTIYREIDSWKVPFKAIWLNTTNQSIGNVWSPETPNNHFPTYSSNNNINNYNYIPSTWSADNGAYLRLKEIVLGYTLPKAWMAKTGFVSNLRIYVSGADLWEKSYISDGWDPEATRKVENKQRFPFNRTVTVGINATF